MYGLLTTGKPVKIMSKISKRAPAHYYEIQIDEAEPAGNPQRPRRRSGNRPPTTAAAKTLRNAIEWIEADHGTRVTIELEARYQHSREASMNTSSKRRLPTRT